MGNNKNNLARELIDLWEHGALLYHSYEWQEAAETFLYLSRVIDQDLQSTFCLLNAVIIFARLGDLSIASQILEEAKRLDETLALTLFIMGHVEFQLDRYDKAEECLRAALWTMQGPNLKFARHGFDFTLWTSQIREDLLVFDNELSNINVPLASFPADALFEAPPRSRGSVATSLRPRNCIDGGSLSPLSEAGESPNDDALPTPISEPTKITSPPRRTSPRQSSYRLDQPRQFRAALVAREARVQGDSVQELSEYIRGLPPRHGLKPRGAEAEYGNVGDLSDFLNEGPGGARGRQNRSTVKGTVSHPSDSSGNPGSLLR